MATTSKTGTFRQSKRAGEAARGHVLSTKDVPKPRYGYPRKPWFIVEPWRKHPIPTAPGETYKRPILAAMGGIFKALDALVVDLTTAPTPLEPRYRVPQDRWPGYWPKPLSTNPRFVFS